VAADRVSVSARQVRKLAADLAGRSDGSDERRSARIAADALGAMSASLEAVAETARASGFALRDRGRDAALALARGERLMRERGWTGAAVGTVALMQRHGRKIAVTGAALIAVAAWRRRRGGGD
jgi:hypothetical protein